ncbi:MAG: diaminopimelate decarboxylase, partial [Chloroflexota bacterium]|nr:diaminopimelate decarboxylase [Chloroflexota bacterium]
APNIDDKRSRGETKPNLSFAVEHDRLSQHTHRYLATGVAESKFGLSIATGDALAAARLVTRHSPPLTLVGLHVHIGSQIFELDPYRDAVAAVLDFARALRDAIGFDLQELDLGGGWGVAYTEEQRTLGVDAVADAIISALRVSGFRFQVQGSNLKPETSNLKLLFEPGRALVAQSAVALYAVGAVKEIPGVRTYVSVDGGMGDNVRPALYGARYTARVANRMNQAPALRVAIAGRYCEQGDILIEDVALPQVAPGDLIAIPCAGAYQVPMASNYNLIPRPAIIAVRDGKPRVIRRRETIEDMLRCETDE